MGRLFGTDGARGVANTELTIELAMNIGKAAAMVLTSADVEHPTFRIGKDTRLSGDMLEGALIARHPEYMMDDRSVFKEVDFESGSVVLGGTKYELLDKRFPTVDPSDPLKLTEDEAELMGVLVNSFRHSRLLNEHIKFLYSHFSQILAKL